jgi:serine/threonine protein kinase
MLQAKQRVGEYVLDAPLGPSPYAETWRAHHHMWEEELALVKVPTHPAYLNNLRQEGVRVHRLVHPSIGRPIGFDPKAEPPYLITEYHGGVSLRAYTSGDKLTVPQAVNILQHVLEGLRFGHERGVVHGDIRPDNILLDPEEAGRNFALPESVQLVDFGIGQAATATFTSEANAKSNSPGNSPGNSLAVALAYVAPEQREGAPPDIKSDVYAVGVVLFEMLTGERPTGAELPSEINAQVPKSLDDAFRKSYARRERRFDSAKSFLDAILQAAGAAVPAPTTAAPSSAPPAPPAPHPGNAASGAPISPAQPRSPNPTTPPAPAGPQAPRAAPITPGLPRPVSIRPTAYGGQVIGFKSDDDAPAPAAPENSRTPDSGGDAGNEISLAASDDDYVPRAVDSSAVDGAAMEGNGPELAASGALDAASDAHATEDEYEVLSDEEDQGVEVSEGHSAGSNEPVLPVIPRVPSKADRDAMFDELGKKQVRSADEVRNGFKGFQEIRDLDEGETVNIRLRLIKWANSMAGGQSDLEDQIILTSAASRPYYAIRLLLRTTRGDEQPRSQALDHPIAELAASSIPSADYRLITHLSGVTLPENLLESITSVPLRTAVMNMVREARREFFGRIMREDLLIFRANIITASYRFDDQKYRVFMVGSTLGVVSAGEPFTRIRQEPTKRAATLLNGEQIFKGIAELRRGLEDQRWESKSSVILSALRGKLAAAYVATAREQFQEFGWLESLDDNAKAGQLVPGHEDALAHAALVRKRLTQLQLVPGLLIAAIFIGMAVNWAAQARPLVPKQAVLQLIQTPFFAAGLGALIAAVWSWRILRLRLARTDITFYHSLLLPTAVAGAIAFFPQKYSNLSGDLICGLLLIFVIVADVLLFKKLARHLFRRIDDATFTGDGLTATNKIESVLHDDWERLKPHYLHLGPLYSYTSATAAATGHVPDLMASESGDDEEPDEAATDRSLADTAGGSDTADGDAAPAKAAKAAPARPASARTAGRAPVGPEVEALAAQMEARISAALRNIGPAARMLVTIINEYSRSVAQHQLGMMQGNATKIEQKGKDLAAKLADFDRLCKSPLALNADSGQVQELSRRLAERAGDPEIRRLQQLAERARTFRSDQTNAIAELNAMLPAVQEVVENLKRG